MLGFKKHQKDTTHVVPEFVRHIPTLFTWNLFGTMVLLPGPSPLRRTVPELGGYNL